MSREAERLQLLAKQLAEANAEFTVEELVKLGGEDQRDAQRKTAKDAEQQRLAQQRSELNSGTQKAVQADREREQKEQEAKQVSNDQVRGFVSSNREHRAELRQLNKDFEGMKRRLELERLAREKKKRSGFGSSRFS